MRIKKSELEKMIQEAVDVYLAEKRPVEPNIRWEPGPFKLGQFRRLKTLKERLRYLNGRTDTEVIGAGSSRIVWFINDKKNVIKLSKWERGKAQNRTEGEASRCGGKQYLPKIFANSPDYSWIIVESVEPIKSKKEFEEATAMNLRWIEAAINFLSPEFRRRPKSDRTYKKYEHIYNTLKKKSPWFRGLVHLADRCGFVAGDIAKWDSWGITKRGRVVLVDYGLTEYVWKRYYERTTS